MTAIDQDLLRKIEEAENDEQVPEEGPVRSPDDKDEEEKEVSSEEALVPLSAKKYDFFRFLDVPAKKIEEMGLSKKEQERLRNSIISLRHGAHASMPLRCGGSKCPAVRQCPFTEFNQTARGQEIDQMASRWPLLEPCPIESVVLGLKLSDLVQEYEVTEEDTTDLAIISKIAELEMLDARLSASLATDGIIFEEIALVDPKGNAIMGKKIHPALEAKEKIGRQLSDLRKAMLGTRREKERMLIARGGGPAESGLVDVMGKLVREVRRALKDEETEYLEAEIIGDDE